MASPVQAPVRPDNEKRRQWLNTKRASTGVKLRHNSQLDKRTRMELGADLVVREGVLSTGHWAGLTWQLDPEGGADRGSIELNSDWFALVKDFTVPLGFSALDTPVTARLGVALDGKPEVNLKVHNLRVAVPVALALLALGRPVSLMRTEVGVLSLDVPLTNSRGVKHPHSLAVESEVSASLQRKKGSGVELDVGGLFALLRLSQKAG